jgi:hypothetical protein
VWFLCGDFWCRKIFQFLKIYFSIRTEPGVRELRTKSGGLGRRVLKGPLLSKSRSRFLPLRGGMTNKKASAKTRTTATARARAEADSSASRGNDNQKGKCKNKNNGKRRTTARAEEIPWTVGPTTRVTAVVARKPEAKALGYRSLLFYSRSSFNRRPFIGLLIPMVTDVTDVIDFLIAGVRLAP